VALRESFFVSLSLMSWHVYKVSSSLKWNRALKNVDNRTVHFRHLCTKNCFKLAQMSLNKSKTWCYRYLRNNGCLTAHTACLVCLISTVNGQSKKKV
jgi:hypothetical protein